MSLKLMLMTKVRPSAVLAKRMRQPPTARRRSRLELGDNEVSLT